MVKAINAVKKKAGRPKKRNIGAELKSAIKKAEANLVNFRRICLGVDLSQECDPAPFHYRWSEILLNEHRNFGVMGFRESGKGQIVLRAFPLYCLTFPSADRDFVVLVKQSSEQAENKLREISQEYLMNPVLNKNLVKIHEQSGRVFSVDVYNAAGEVVNVRFQSFGKGKAIRGLSYGDRRPKIVIADDIQDFDDARSDTILDHDWDWFISDVKMLGKNTRFFLIGNNLGEGCLIERVKLHHEEMGFEFEVVPAMDEMNEVGTWDAMFPYDFLIKEREQYRRMGKLDTWYRERMCQATTEEYRVFKKSDRRYYVPSLINTLMDDRQSKIFVTLDPASSSNKQSCFRALVVNAVNSKGQWFILDVPYGRWDSSELIDQIFATMKRYRAREIGIEKGAFKQIIEPFIYKEMSKRKDFFDIIPIEHGREGSKLERIKMLGPRFKSHEIWFPTDAPWLAEMEAELDGVSKDIINSRFIDLVDALAMQEQIVKKPSYRNQDISKLPRKY